MINRGFLIICGFTCLLNNAYADLTSAELTGLQATLPKIGFHVYGEPIQDGSGALFDFSSQIKAAQQREQEEYQRQQQAIQNRALENQIQETSDRLERAQQLANRFVFIGTSTSFYFYLDKSSISLLTNAYQFKMFLTERSTGDYYNNLTVYMHNDALFCSPEKGKICASKKDYKKIPPGSIYANAYKYLQTGGVYD